MEKYSLICMTHPRALCFLSLSISERKVIVGIVDAFSERGNDVGRLVSVVR